MNNFNINTSRTNILEKTLSFMWIISTLTAIFMMWEGIKINNEKAKYLRAEAGMLNEVSFATKDTFDALRPGDPYYYGNK